MTRPKAMPKAIPPPSPSSSGSESEASSSDDDEENHQQQQQQQAKEAARAKASPSPVKKKPVVVPKQQQNVVSQERMASPPPAKKKSVLKNKKKPPPPVPPPPAPAADADSSDEEASDSPPKAKPTPPFSRPRDLKPSRSTEPTSLSKPEVPTIPDADADASSSDEEASDSPPKAKPTPSFSRPRDLKPSRSTEPTSFSKPEVPSPADADASSSGEEASNSPPKAKPTPSFSRPRDLKPSISTEPTSFSKPEVPTPAAASQQSHKGKERKRQREEAGGKQEGDAAAVGGPSSNKLFQRVWTVEDEITFLKGMLDFQEKHGVPFKMTDAFFEFISSNLQGDFSKIQLHTKIRALRKKYERNLQRGKKDADPSFAKPHEQVAFEISKKLWPIVEGDAHDYRGNGTSVNTKDGGRKTGDQGASLLYPSLTEAINLLGKEDDNSFLAQTASRALESLKSTKLKALEDRWSKHFIAGVNYLMERAKLKKDLLQSLVEIIDSE